VTGESRGLMLLGSREEGGSADPSM
jgi:hypothetical protein